VQNQLLTLLGSKQVRDLPRAKDLLDSQFPLLGPEDLDKATQGFLFWGQEFI